MGQDELTAADEWSNALHYALLRETFTSRPRRDEDGSDQPCGGLLLKCLPHEPSRTLAVVVVVLETLEVLFEGLSWRTLLRRARCKPPLPAGDKGGEPSFTAVASCLRSAIEGRDGDVRMDCDISRGEASITLHYRGEVAGSQGEGITELAISLDLTTLGRKEGPAILRDHLLSPLAGLARSGIESLSSGSADLAPASHRAGVAAGEGLQKRRASQRGKEVDQDVPAVGLAAGLLADLFTARVEPSSPRGHLASYACGLHGVSPPISEEEGRQLAPSGPGAATAISRVMSPPPSNDGVDVTVGSSERQSLSLRGSSPDEQEQGDDATLSASGKHRNQSRSSTSSPLSPSITHGAQQSDSISKSTKTDLEAEADTTASTDAKESVAEEEEDMVVFRPTSTPAMSGGTFPASGKSASKTPGAGTETRSGQGQPQSESQPKARPQQGVVRNGDDAHRRNSRQSSADGSDTGTEDDREDTDGKSTAAAAPQATSQSRSEEEEGLDQVHSAGSEPATLPLRSPSPPQSVIGRRAASGIPTEDDDDRDAEFGGTKNFSDTLDAADTGTNAGTTSSRKSSPSNSSVAGTKQGASNPSSSSASFIPPPPPTSQSATTSAGPGAARYQRGLAKRKRI